MKCSGEGRKEEGQLLPEVCFLKLEKQKELRCVPRKDNLLSTMHHNYPFSSGSPSLQRRTSQVCLPLEPQSVSGCEGLWGAGCVVSFRGERSKQRSVPDAVRGSNGAKRTFLSWACAPGVSILISNLSVQC